MLAALLIVGSVLALTTAGATKSLAEGTAVQVIQLDAAATRLDPRLARLVSLPGRIMPLKVVLDQISHQTGIAVSIDSRDAASGYQLFASCDGAAAGSIMDALFGLLSIRRGEWAWARISGSAGYTYALHETPWAKNRTETYGRILDGLLSNYLAVLRDLAPMEMQERMQHREALKKALYLEDNADVAPFFEDEIFWTEAKFFLAALTPDQQEGALQGHDVTVALQALPKDAYEYFHQQYLHLDPHQRNADGSLSPIPEPDTVVFMRSVPSRARRDIAPMVMLKCGTMRQSWMGTGHLQLGVRKAIKHAWMLPGDALIDTAGQKAVSDTPDTEDMADERRQAAAAAQRFSQSPHAGLNGDAISTTAASIRSSLGLGSSLAKLSRGSATSVLAIVSTDARQGVESPVGTSVRAFADSLEAHGMAYFYKWRAGVLLINHPYWFAGPVAVISYALLGSVQSDKARNRPAAAWGALMSAISEDQAGWLAETCRYGGEGMKHLRPLLLLLDKYPRLLDGGGTDIADDMLQFLQADTAIRDILLAATEHTRIRITSISSYDSSTEAVPVISLERYDAENRNWISLQRLSLPKYFAAAQATRPLQ